MDIKKLDTDFSVCRVNDLRPFAGKEFCFTAATDEELSLVCPTRDAPADALARNDGWRAFRIDGVLDFSLVGILSAVLDILRECGIAVFALSTYNTDYVFIKKQDFKKALCALEARGYAVK